MPPPRWAWRPSWGVASLRGQVREAGPSGGAARGGCRWRGWGRPGRGTCSWVPRLPGGGWAPSPLRPTSEPVEGSAFRGVAADHKYPTGNWRNEWAPFLSEGRWASVPCPEDLPAQRSVLCALWGWRQSQPAPTKAQGLPVCLKMLKGHRGTLPIILSLIHSF